MGYLYGKHVHFESYRQKFYRKMLAFWMLEKGKFGELFFIKKKKKEGVVS